MVSCMTRRMVTMETYVARHFVTIEIIMVRSMVNKDGTSRGLPITALNGVIDDSDQKIRSQANWVSVSGSTSVAIRTLLEAVFQHLCSLTLCLQQGRGYTLDSLYLQNLSCHVVTMSRFIPDLALNGFLSFPVVAINHPPGSSSHCIPIGQDCSHEIFEPNVQLERF